MIDVKIFISHSSLDKELVKKFIDLFRLSLNLKDREIRCTSIDGYKLNIGNNIEKQIKAEVYDVNVLLALITPFSLKSVYFLFELGARWGAEKPFFPVFARGITPDSTVTLIQQFHGANCDSRGDLLQLVENVSDKLGLEVASAQSYSNIIDEIIEISNRLKSLDSYEYGNPNPEIQERNKLEMWEEDMELGDVFSDFWNVINTYYIKEFRKDTDPDTLEGLVFASGCPMDATTPNTELITWFSRNSHYFNHDQRRIWELVTSVYPSREKNQVGDVWEYSVIKPPEEARKFHRARRKLATYFVKWTNSLGTNFITTTFGSRRGYIILIAWLELALVRWTNQEGPGKQSLFKLAEYINKISISKHRI